MGYVRKVCRICLNKDQKKRAREKAKRLKDMRSYYS